ncbi:MAG: hypothetical protein V7L22_03665 [Nostoc sp.]|uniref:hypothetical protein n=1 Tax=Nostoc sp. TaxID=1180 RepID=UPI002FFBC4F0
MSEENQKNQPTQNVQASEQVSSESSGESSSTPTPTPQHSKRRRKPGGQNIREA